MEKAAKDTLRRLKEVCLNSIDPESQRDQYYDDVTTMVTLSAMTLQHIIPEDVHSVGVAGTSHDSVRVLLEAAALEGLQELGTKEIRTSDTQQTTPYMVGFETDDFWSHCRCLVQFSSNVQKSILQSVPFKQTISSLHRFSLGTSHLLTAFLSVSKAVLNEHQMLTILSHLYNKFWSKEAKTLAEQVTSTKADKYMENSTVESGDSVAILARLMATLHCLLSVHNTLKTSLMDLQNPEECKTKSLSIRQNRAVNQWLCQNVLDLLLDLLTASAPKLLLTAYRGTLEQDKEALHKGAKLGEVSEHLTAINLLTSALHCLSKLSQEVIKSCSPSPPPPPSPSPSSSKDTRGLLLSSVTSETSLRLTNHYWEHLCQLTKKVPSELPANALCLFLASFIKLHSFLSRYNLPFNNEQKEAHSFLLHALSESCEGLREQLVSYHTQLCLTSLLHDGSSQDWTSTKPFFEGERGSYTVQMWRYHMLGLRHDLCTLLAPASYKLAERILLGVLSGSLSHLTRRYSLSTPSHARLNQFRADILSIFSTVLSLQPQLRHHTVAGHSNHCSPEITLIHRSCNQLLNVLTIGACPLADLEEVLNQHSLSPIKGRDDKDETSAESKRENVFHESIKGCSCQWVSILERHQVAELLTTSSHMRESAAEGGEGTSIYGHELGAAADHGDDGVMSLFPFVLKSGGVPWSATQQLINIRISVTQPNIAPSLLQALLSNNMSLAVTLCLTDNSRSSYNTVSAHDSLVTDIASLLSLCCHDEWALSNFYKRLRTFPEERSRDLERNSSELKDRNLIKLQEEAVLNWLSQQLQIELESNVLSRATGLHGNLHDNAKIWQHLHSSLVCLGERLSKMDLLNSIINLIWSLADDVSKRDGSSDGASDGASLAKVVGFLVSRWPIFAHLRLSDGPLGAFKPDSTHCIRPVDSAHHNLQLPDGPLRGLVTTHLHSMVCILAGLKLSQLQDIPHNVQAVISSHQTELQSWLNQFDQFLPRANTHGGSGQREEPTLAECEAIWEVISEDDVMVMSLERIHNALVRQSRGSRGHGFNPQGKYNDVPTMEIVDNIDWKGLVSGVIVGGATTPTVCHILETVRWEFQDGASGYLEERETELMKALRRHLHYKDDCTV